MQAYESKHWQEGIDSKALLVCFLQKMPYLLLMGVAGAVLGSGLYLLITVMTSSFTLYQSETEYYIDFSDESKGAKDWYNAYTWNQVMKTDLVMDNVMKTLGPSYEKESVKTMVGANILSDVRYLTITIEADDAEMVGAVSKAIKQSLEQLGNNMEEFESIYQIEDNGVQLVERELFTWRALLVGCVSGIILGIFLISVDFCVGSKYYTKHSLSKSLNILVFGLVYGSKNRVLGEQEETLHLTLQYWMKKTNSKQVVIVDVIDGSYSRKCKGILDELNENGAEELKIQVQDSKRLTKEDYDTIRQTDGVILAIPFGKSCREAAIEKISQLENQDCKIVGAILVDVNRKWMKRYGIE